MVDVFISYSRANQAQVAVLAEAIEREGYSVWWDKELPPHLSYGDVITEKIAQARAAVVVWSRDAAKSEWVRAEADMARNQKKLVQTALDDVMPPLPFNQIQYAEIGDWQGEPDHSGWRKVKASLADLCGAREASPVPPAPPRYQTPATAPVTAQPPAATASSRWPLWAGGALAAVLLVVAGGWLLGGGEAEPAGPPDSEREQGADDVDKFALGATVSDPDGYTNVRASGAISASVIARINVGERFRTFRQPGTWWEVQLDDGTTGYVARSRIVLDGEPMPSAPAQAAAAPAPAQPVVEPDWEGRPPPAFASGDFTFPDSSTRRLTQADIAGLGPATLRIARNEIFARKGRRFRDPDLVSHFSQFAWYRPVANEVQLTRIEQANVALLAAAERRYGQ
ncbi:MAG: YARHG domain-containing protein [Sphingomonadaceae bacterium]|nr:YARHG domain-containing protein [Sphingomonadaceae bacterium]